MKLRIATHCKDMSLVSSFYKEILRLNEIGGFENHNGYDGVMLGGNYEAWHFEFTQNNSLHQHNPRGPEDAVVIYPETERQYSDILQRIIDCNCKILKHPNPYWNQNAISIKDPEGNWLIVNKK